MEVLTKPTAAGMRLGKQCDSRCTTHRTGKPAACPLSGAINPWRDEVGAGVITPTPSSPAAIKIKKIICERGYNLVSVGLGVCVKSNLTAQTSRPAVVVVVVVAVCTAGEEIDSSPSTQSSSLKLSTNKRREDTNGRPFPPLSTQWPHEGGVAPTPLADRWDIRRSRTEGKVSSAHLEMETGRLEQLM
ncbi:hypothetical protein RRG08_011151 [Elysia crispata]|uniref:Uncharacterized protein n=1 Tax=Elysia crispata TaxID=231223 RepID=A0AAE1A2K1_9GAST|nr:hypothetical protein RRG08_011151 [Elysia crispata]